MFSRMSGFAWLAVCLPYASVALAQTLSAAAVQQPCDKGCQQQKIDALSKAMDSTEPSRHPKPSDSTECAAYDGRESSDVVVDVCAELKYVRTLPVGTETAFACPGDTRQLVGLSPASIRSIWGEPDYEARERWRDPSSPLREWAYFIGSPKPGTHGGGFPALSLHFNGTSRVESVMCALSK